MLNRFYEYNSNPLGVRSLLKIEGDKSGVSFDLTAQMRHSMELLGNYIGYVKAHNIMDDKRGLQIPIDRSKRTPIWSIKKLAKHEGVSIEDEDFLRKATKILRGKTFTVEDSVDSNGRITQSFARGSGAISTRPYTTKNVTNPESENPYIKYGKETKNWEDSELTNERILLKAISEAFTKLGSSNFTSWEETIDIPIFNYLDDKGKQEHQLEIPNKTDLDLKYGALEDEENKKKDVLTTKEFNEIKYDFKRTSIEFTQERVTIKDLVFFFIATVGQKVNSAYSVLIEDTNHNDESITNVGTNLATLGIKDSWDWTLTSIRIISKGPFFAADELFPSQSRKRDNMFNKGLFEYDKGNFKNFLDLSKPAEFILSDNNYHDVGLIGLYASLLFPKPSEIRTQKFYQTYFGKFIEELVNKDLSKEKTSYENIEYTDEEDNFNKSSDNTIVINDTDENRNRFEKAINGAHELKRLSDNYIGDINSVLIDALLARKDRFNQVHTDIEKSFVDRYFSGGKGNFIIRKKDTIIFDLYMGRLLGGLTDTGTMLYSGVFGPSGKPDDENHPEKYNILSLQVSPNFIRCVFGKNKDIRDFFGRSTVEPLNLGSKASIISINTLINRRDNDTGKNVFETLNLPLEKCRVAYNNILWGDETKPVNLGMTRKIEREVLYRLFKVDNLQVKNSETAWVRSFHLNKQLKNNNKLNQAFDGINLYLENACKKNGHVDIDTLNRYVKPQFNQKKVSLSDRIINIKKLVDGIYNDCTGPIGEKIQNKLDKSFFSNIEVSLYMESLFNKILKKSLREELFEGVFNKSHI